MTGIPIDVDKTTGMAYIWLFGENEAHGVARTISVEANLDIDADGKVVGIEVFGWPNGATS